MTMSMKSVFFVTAFMAAALLRVDAAYAVERMNTRKVEVITDAHKQMFAASHYAELDKRLNNIQLQFEAGKLDDRDLASMFTDPFRGRDPALLALHDAWVKAYPKSYAARQARAYYLMRRSYKFFAEAKQAGAITVEQSAQLKQFAMQSVAEALAAAELVKKPLMSYAVLAESYNLLGEAAKARWVALQSAKFAPDNLVARLWYVNTAVDMGGALADMHAVVADGAQGGLNHEDMGTLSKDYYRALLREGQFKVLDADLNRVQAQYEAGQMDDIALSEYFSFHGRGGDPAMAAQHDAWVQQFPQSYAARHARAQYFFDAASKARGHAYIKDTSADEIAGFRMYMERAFDDAQGTYGLTKKPILTQSLLAGLYMMQGQQEGIRQMLDQSLQTDPKNFIVRSRYMWSLQTRWGGSLEQMEGFLEDMKKAGIRQDKIAFYEDMLLTEKAWLVDIAKKEEQDISQMKTGF